MNNGEQVKGWRSKPGEAEVSTDCAKVPTLPLSRCISRICGRSSITAPRGRVGMKFSDSLDAFERVDHSGAGAL